MENQDSHNEEDQSWKKIIENKIKFHFSKTSSKWKGYEPQFPIWRHGKLHQ